MTSQIIDIHPHIASHDTARYPITPLGGKRSDWSHERSVTAEEMIAAMDEAGVDKCAMVHSSTTYGFNCEYCADAVAAYPKRMTGVFSVNVIEPDGPQKMRYWYNLGCTGMRIYAQGSTMSKSWLTLDDPRIHPCYETARELGISVAANIRLNQYPEIEAAMKLFPQVRFILDHAGKTDLSDGPPYNASAPLWRLAANYPNLYLKVTTDVCARASKGEADPATLVAKFVSEFGSGRIAWGSNYPSAKGTLKSMVELARSTFQSLPQKDQDNIFSGTALTLYPALKD